MYVLTDSCIDDILIVYSRDFSISQSTLEALAKKMKAQCPSEFIKAAANFNQFADQALLENRNIAKVYALRCEAGGLKSSERET